MEQTARALNAVCRLWLAGRRASSASASESEFEHVAAVIRYHQARNQAAKRSRQRTVQMTT